MVKLEGVSDAFGTIGNGLMSITHLELAKILMKERAELMKDRVALKK